MALHIFCHQLVTHSEYGSLALACHAQLPLAQGDAAHFVRLPSSVQRRCLGQICGACFRWTGGGSYAFPTLAAQRICTPVRALVHAVQPALCWSALFQAHSSADYLLHKGI